MGKKKSRGRRRGRGKEKNRTARSQNNNSDNNAEPKDTGTDNTGIKKGRLTLQMILKVAMFHFSGF